MELLDTLHLLTVEEYMTIETEARTELLGGLICDVSPRNEPHRHALRKLNGILARELPREYTVQPQDAIAVHGWLGRDAPEVDIAILRDREYTPGPTAADTVAFIEISHTTYRLDRTYKIPLYVNAGVPSYIVNISARRVEYFPSPSELETEPIIFNEGDTVTIVGVTIRVADLFQPESM